MLRAGENRAAAGSASMLVGLSECAGASIDCSCVESSCSTPTVDERPCDGDNALLSAAAAELARSVATAAATS